MNAVAKIEPRQPTRSVIVAMADRYEMEPAAFEATVRATVCKGTVSREEFAAFLLVAKEHRLNPLTKEIYAFPAKGGGIQPIVSIDGWARIINEHPAFDGMEFIDERDDGELVAITCRMFRKDRAHPIAATEYMAECKRGTDVWKTWPRRMLRHKAMIQAARYAFGFSGIVDPDEYERLTTVPTQERPGVRQRLLAPGAEGFSHAVDPETGEIREAPAEPQSFAEHAEEIADAEFETAADPGPDLSLDEAPPADDAPDTWDAAAYAQGQRDNADAIRDPAIFEAWWSELSASEDAKRLWQADEAAWKGLKAHCAARLRTLKAAS